MNNATDLTTKLKHGMSGLIQTALQQSFKQEVPQIRFPQQNSKQRGSLSLGLRGYLELPHQCLPGAISVQAVRAPSPTRQPFRRAV